MTKTDIINTAIACLDAGICITGSYCPEDMRNTRRDFELVKKIIIGVLENTPNKELMDLVGNDTFIYTYE